MKGLGNLAGSGTAIAVALCLYSATAQSADTIKESIGIAISPDEGTDARIDAANDVVGNWQDSLPLLLNDINSYYSPTADSAYPEAATAKLIPLTDLLSRILIDQDRPVQRFRESDTKKTVDLLAAAAGGTERNLRANASYILARVVDDNNFCVILHRLRDPKLSYAGKVNLLQVAIAATNTAARQNVNAAKEIAEVLKDNGEAKVAGLAGLLEQLSSSRARVAPPLPTNSYCLTFNVDTGEAPLSPDAPSP